MANKNQDYPVLEFVRVKDGAKDHIFISKKYDENTDQFVYKLFLQPPAQLTPEEIQFLLIGMVYKFGLDSTETIKVPDVKFEN